MITALSDRGRPARTERGARIEAIERVLTEGLGNEVQSAGETPAILACIKALPSVACR